MKATTPFSGTSSRRVAKADRERVARLDAVLETIVDQPEALLVRLLRFCAHAVVDAPLAKKPALREDLARMQLDAMKQCSALFDAQHRVEGLVLVVSSRNLSASQAASYEQRLEAERDQKDDEALDHAELRWRVAKAAKDTAAVNAALEAWHASKAVVSAKLPEEKKQLRGKRDQCERAANTARCRCQSTCVLGGVEFLLRLNTTVPSYRRHQCGVAQFRGGSASSR